MVPNGKKYLDYAEKILKSLSSDAYLAKVGENQGFILMHSVGSLPNGSEIDTPLNYADYYYLEALKRFMDFIHRLPLVSLPLLPAEDLPFCLAADRLKCFVLLSELVSETF